VPAPPPGELPTVTFEGTKFTVRQGGRVVQAGTQKLKPSSKPAQLVVTIVEGEDAGKIKLGIYKIKRDRLTLCFGPPSKKRPDDFTAPPGSGYCLITATRMGK
jgi:uncharacterized protein (TIGR03067 family)